MNITKAVVIVVAISAVLLAAWVFQRRPGAEPPAEVRQGTPDEDARVLQQLVAAGADLSKPHNLEFFLYFPDQERATKACDELKGDGYTGKVQPGGGEEAKWQCMATKRLVPSHDAITAISRRMEDLATAQGGSYNGWGTLAVR